MLKEKYFYLKQNICQYYLNYYSEERVNNLFKQLIIVQTGRHKEIYLQNLLCITHIVYHDHQSHRLMYRMSQVCDLYLIIMN